MALSEQGFAVIDLKRVPAAILDDGGGYRPIVRSGPTVCWRRSVEFRISWTADDDWFIHLARGAVDPDGSVVRCHGLDFSPIVRAVLWYLRLDLSTDWRIRLTQVRTVATSTSVVPVRSCLPSTADAEFVVVAALGGHGADATNFRLYRHGERDPLWTGRLRPGVAVVLDRRDLAYDVGEMVTGDGSQEILVVAFSRWTAEVSPPAAVPTGRQTRSAACPGPVRPVVVGTRSAGRPPRR
jgi:hypothetical protein